MGAVLGHCPEIYVPAWYHDRCRAVVAVYRAPSWAISVAAPAWALDHDLQRHRVSLDHQLD